MNWEMLGTLGEDEVVKINGYDVDDEMQRVENIGEEGMRTRARGWSWTPGKWRRAGKTSWNS